jgi:hypothetical protein
MRLRPASIRVVWMSASLRAASLTALLTLMEPTQLAELTPRAQPTQPTQPTQPMWPTPPIRPIQLTKQTRRTQLTNLTRLIQLTELTLSAHWRLAQARSARQAQRWQAMRTAHLAWCVPHGCSRSERSAG